MDGELMVHTLTVSVSCGRDLTPKGILPSALGSCPDSLCWLIRKLVCVWEAHETRICQEPVRVGGWLVTSPALALTTAGKWVLCWCLRVLLL